MVLVPSHALPSEHGWEPQTFRDLILANLLIAAFWLSNNELANLRLQCQWESNGSGNVHAYLKLCIRDSRSTHARVA